MYSAPSGPKRTSPIEWLGNCWHQSFTSTVSFVIWLVAGLMVRRDSRPLTTQPLVVAPGGVGQPSESAPAVPHLGAVPPIAASKVYET